MKKSAQKKRTEKNSKQNKSVNLNDLLIFLVITLKANFMLHVFLQLVSQNKKKSHLILFGLDFLLTHNRDKKKQPKTKQNKKMHTLESHRWNFMVSFFFLVPLLHILCHINKNYTIYIYKIYTYYIIL